jgi:hypothetical protein
MLYRVEVTDDGQMAFGEAIVGTTWHGISCLAVGNRQSIFSLRIMCSEAGASTLFDRESTTARRFGKGSY